MKRDLKTLKAVFNEHIDVVARAARTFPWEDRYAYAFWLAQHYYFVRHTSTYLALAAGKYGVDHPDLHRETLKHLREETGHEALPVHDIKKLGFDIADLPELTETALLYQAQYYWIERHGPMPHAGYALMLEGLAAKEGPNIVGKLLKLYGKEAMGYLLVHTDDDVDHFAQGLERLLKGTEAQLALVEKNLVQSRTCYVGMLDAIKAQLTSGQQKKAA